MTATMTKEEMIELGEILYMKGDATRGWQSRMAEELGYTIQTISNWATGRTDVPVVVAELLRCKYNQLTKRTD